MFNQWKLILSRALLLGLPLAYGSAHAANPVDLSDATIATISKMSDSQVQFSETRRSVDFNNTMHVHFQQTYMGYQVWGGDGIVHIPQGKNTNHSIAEAFATAQKNAGWMNGIVYQNLSADLAKEAVATLADNSQTALTQAIANYQHKIGTQMVINNKQSETIVYVDDNNKAHWAYLVSFDTDAVKAGELPAKMIYIMDAKTLQIYQQWNNIQTATPPAQITPPGGGYGGNIKMGKLVYDGGEGDLASLNVTRDPATKTCTLQNSDVTVLDYHTHKAEFFTCKHVDASHNKTLWDGSLDEVNNSYSPGNDALFGGAVIKNMYKDWYGLEVLRKSDGTPMMLTMVVHDPIGDNAYWDGSKMSFGDGVNYFYALTSLGVAAHEISHGFTQQHSNLIYSRQSGGMNEAFSDMAAQGAEHYAYGKNSWQIGPEIFKAKDQALRYMDQPSKDCRGKKPGSWCSIDTASQYYDGLDVHFSSGVYNHLFYLMGTSEGWDVKKAFDVMVKANTDYWTSNATFKTGACGVIAAAKDYKYNMKSLKKALAAVELSCDNHRLA